MKKKLFFYNFWKEAAWNIHEDKQVEQLDAHRGKIIKKKKEPQKGLEWRVCAEETEVK